MDESDARRLFGTVETLPVRPVHPAALQRRRTVWVPVAASAAVAGLAVAAVAALPRDASRDARPAAAPVCPGGPDLRLWSPGPPPRDPGLMVSPGPASVLVCSEPGHGAGVARAATVAGDSDLATRMVAALNAIEPTSHDYNCMLDPGSWYLVVFGYADGHEENVLISPLGCRAVNNGVRYAAYANGEIAPLVEEALA